MITIDDTRKFTTQGTGKVILRRTLNVCGINPRQIIIEGEYDFSQIPEEDHEIILEYLMLI